MSEPSRAPRAVRILNSPSPIGEMIGHPAYFGPDMDPGSVLRGVAVLGNPLNGCTVPTNDDKLAFVGKILVVHRGECSFMTKVRQATSLGYGRCSESAFKPLWRRALGYP